jgi:hypothetical protein
MLRRRQHRVETALGDLSDPSARLTPASFTRAAGKGTERDAPDFSIVNLMNAHLPHQPMMPAMLISKVVDGVGWLKVTKFPVRGREIAKQIDRAIQELNGVTA